MERPPEELSELRDRACWLDIADPGAKELALVAEELGLHPLAVEDARERHQRPKVEEYEGHYFIVWYAVEAGGGDGDLELHELSIFVAQNAIVTVREDDFPTRQEVEKRWRAGRIPSSAMLLHALLDTTVDDCFRVTDRLSERVDALEQAMVGAAADPRRVTERVRELFRLKRELLQLRRHVAPEREVLVALTREDLGMFERADVAYFRDVYDHVVRVTEEIDVLRDIVSSVVDAYLAASSNRLNEVVKVLTAVATILLVVTVITGFFGMNFSALPFDSPLALWVVVVAMVLVTGGLIAFFRRLGWL